MEPTEQDNSSVSTVQSEATSALPGLTTAQYDEHIVASGISFDVAKRYGVRGVTAEEARSFGFEGEQARDGLLLPMYWDGEKPILHQLRPWVPRIGSNGKSIKYETPAGHIPVLARSPLSFGNINDPRHPIIFTEGVKKLLAWETKARRLGTTLLRLGEGSIAAPVPISLMGVRGWMGPNECGGRGIPLAALREIPFRGDNNVKRPVILAFDSDMMTKPDVHAALRELKDYLGSRGANVLVMYLPSGTDRSKVGLDDFLVSGHSLQDALNCCEADLRSLADAPSLLTVSELLSQPALPWTVRGLVPAEGLSILYGPFGSFKSFVLLDWLACISAGVPEWFGLPIDRHGPCVYIYSEGRTGIGQRVNSVRLARRLPDDFPLYVLPNAIDITSARERSALIELIRSRLGNRSPAAVAIDTVSRNMPGRDANAPVDMNAFVAGCDAIKQAFGCQVIAVHHPTKAKGDPRGALDLSNSADTIIKIEREKDREYEARITVEKQKDADHGTPRLVRLRPEAGSLTLAELRDVSTPAGVVGALKKLPDKRHSAFRALAIAGNEGLTYGDWLRAADEEGVGSESTFKSARGYLVKDVEFVRLIGDRYQITARGAEYAVANGWNPIY